MEEAADIFFRTAMAGDVWPSYLAAPVSESFQAFEYFAASAEYNVMQTMDSLLYVTGYLAAQGMNQAVRDGPHADVLRAANGGDIVLGAEGADSIHGGHGDDRIAGGRDDDWLHGGRGDASLFGDQGSDWLFGGDGNDVLAGGSENDSITGGRREDRLLSGDGGDNLWGGFGNDTLLGGDGDDRLVGGAGNDILDGGSGNETLISGLGADMFIFGQGSGRDTMSDFAATEDRIRIDTAAGTDSDAFLASGTFRADRFGFTLDLRGGGRLLIVSQAPLTLQQLTFSMELI
jgi:Ca2+-binding RTX toxin-like protein